jgi:hypothetical protein
MRVPLKLQYSRTKLKLYLSFVQPFPYEPGGREFDNLAVFGQVDRRQPWAGDPEGVSAQRE